MSKKSVDGLSVSWKALLSASLTDTALNDKFRGKERNIFDLFIRRVNDSILTTNREKVVTVAKGPTKNQQKGSFFEELCKELLLSRALLKSFNIVSVWRLGELTAQQRDFL